MVAIAVDPVADNRRLADGLGLEFPVLSDADREAIADWGVVHAGGGLGGSDIARPAVFVVGPDGIVRWRNLTDNWRVRTRPDAILAAIRSLPPASP